MRVWCVPAGDDASGNLRVIWPALTLANQGHDVHALPIDWTLDAHVDDQGIVREVAPVACDVLVLQRLQLRQWCQAIPLLQAQGVAIVVDVDDAFALVHPRNVAYGAVHPKMDPDRNWQWLAEACRLADLVTCTTPALAAIYGRHGRVAVVPNRLPEQVLTIDHQEQDGPLRIGWAGNIEVHPDDLQVTRGAVGRAMRDLGCTYTNVGPGGTAKAMGVPRESVTGFVEPRSWFATIARELDVAVVPLASTRFNEAKSGLKLLEASSVGVPAVASPTPDNRRLHALGMGVLAEGNEWWSRLRHMVVDAGWRSEVAERSKEAARGEALEAHADEWLEAWEQAVHLHHNRHPTTPAR